jgi:hypothetical protein
MRPTCSAASVAETPGLCQQSAQYTERSIQSAQYESAALGGATYRTLLRIAGRTPRPAWGHDAYSAGPANNNRLPSTSLTMKFLAPQGSRLMVWKNVAPVA